MMLINSMRNTTPAAIPHQTATKVTKSTPDLQEQIRLRANELYEQRRTKGHEIDDWPQAESEVAQQKEKTVVA
jgi:Protein of unknown function (DUF2934)